MALPNTLQFWELVASIVGPVVIAYIGVLVAAFKWYNYSQKQKNASQDSILKDHAEILSKLDKKLEGIEQIFSSKFEQINSKLESEFKGIHRDIGSLTSEIKVLQAEGKERSRLTADHATRIKELEAKIQDLELHISVLENKKEEK